MERILVDFDATQPHLEEEAQARAQSLADSHDRVRRAVARSGSAAAKVAPELPAAVLGAYVYLPGGAA